MVAAAAAAILETSHTSQYAFSLRSHRNGMEDGTKWNVKLKKMYTQEIYHWKCIRSCSKLFLSAQKLISLAYVAVPLLVPSTTTTLRICAEEDIRKTLHSVDCVALWLPFRCSVMTNGALRQFHGHSFGALRIECDAVNYFHLHLSQKSREETVRRRL